MDLAKAMRPEHAGESDGVEVRQVRRRKATLPHAVKGSMETEAAEEPREPEKHALAVWKYQNEVASRR